MIDPCLTRMVPKAQIVCRFRRATFDIRLNTGASRCRKAQSIHCDGQLVVGNTQLDYREGRHRVDVVIWWFEASGVRLLDLAVTFSDLRRRSRDCDSGAPQVR